MAIIFSAAIQVTRSDLCAAMRRRGRLQCRCGRSDRGAPRGGCCELYRKTSSSETLNAESEPPLLRAAAELAHGQCRSGKAGSRRERTREREAALAQVHEMRKVKASQLTAARRADFHKFVVAVARNLELVASSCRTTPSPSADRRRDQAPRWRDGAT